MDGAAAADQACRSQAVLFVAETTRRRSYQIDEPLLGLGFGRRPSTSGTGVYHRVKGDPHNSYVCMLAGGGVLALGGFLFLLWEFRARRDQAAPLCCVVTDRGLVLWALSAWFIFMVNCAMAPFLPRP